MSNVQSVIFRSSSYKMMTDRSIIQSSTGSELQQLSFADAARLAGVLNSIAVFIKTNFGKKVVLDEGNLTNIISPLVAMCAAQGRLSDDTFFWLDYAELAWRNEKDGYEKYSSTAREWDKVLHIVARRVLPS